MKPMALVQYEMLLERITAEHVARYSVLPSIGDALAELSRLAPTGLGKPLPVNMEHLQETYNRLWWNYLFLQRGLHDVQRGVERAMQHAQTRIREAEWRLVYLQRKVDGLALRDPEVLYTVYDTFTSTSLLDVQASDVMIDTSRGEVRLRPSVLASVSAPFTMSVSPDGVTATLSATHAVRVSGVRVTVVGSAVVSILATTSAGVEEVFHASLSGRSDVEFGTLEVTRIEARVVVGTGRLQGITAFIREYQRQGTLLSRTLDIRSSLQGRRASTLRLSVDAETPSGTGVESFVRFVDGAPSEWIRADRPVALPLEVRRQELRDSWEQVDNMVYRNSTPLPTSNAVVTVGSNQWLLRTLRMDAEDARRLMSNLAVQLDEERVLRDSSPLGFVRYVPAAPVSDSGVQPIQEFDADDFLYLVTGQDNRFVLHLGALAPGYTYCLIGWFYSESGSELPVSLSVSNVTAGFACAVSVNGRFAVLHRVNSSRVSPGSSGGTVDVHAGWNCVRWYLMLATATSATVSLSFGASEVNAYGRPFAPCSAHSLRYDPACTEGYYALYSEGGSHYVELAIPVQPGMAGSVRTRPPRVVVEYHDPDQPQPGVQLMFRLSTENGATTPVLRSYRLEVL